MRSSFGGAGERPAIQAKASESLKYLKTALTLTILLAGMAMAQPDFSTPEATWQTYLNACQAGDFEAADLCYTASSRDYLKQDPRLTEGRDPEILKATYEKLTSTEFTLERVNSKRAIMRAADESIPPYFLRIQKPSEGWRIDLHFMSSYIRVNETGWSWTFPRAEGIWKSRK